MASESEIIKTAAQFALGRRYNELYDICELQNTVSTRKLEKLIDKLAAEDRRHALFLRGIEAQLRARSANNA